MKKLLKILPILLIISTLAYLAGTRDIFHDMVPTKTVNGEIPASEPELGETVASETDLPWFERDTVTFELGKYYRLSGRNPGDYIYTGMTGISGKGTITFRQINTGFLVFYVELNDVIHIDDFKYEVIRITRDSIRLKKIE